MGHFLAKCFLFRENRAYWIHVYLRQFSTKKSYSTFFTYLEYTINLETRFSRKRSLWRTNFIPSFRHYVFKRRNISQLTTSRGTYIEFQGQHLFLYYILLIEGKTFSRNLMVLLKKDKKVAWSFNSANACVLTATLWFWTRGCLFYLLF